jgi:hypothetical protein
LAHAEVLPQSLSFEVFVSEFKSNRSARQPWPISQAISHTIKARTSSTQSSHRSCIKQPISGKGHKGKKESNRERATEEGEREQLLSLRLRIARKRHIRKDTKALAREQEHERRGIEGNRESSKEGGNIYASSLENSSSLSHIMSSSHIDRVVLI